MIGKDILSCVLYVGLSPLATTVNKYLFSHATSRIIGSRSSVLTYIQQLYVLVITLACTRVIYSIREYIPKFASDKCTKLYIYIYETPPWELAKTQFRFIKLAALFSLQLFFSNFMLKNVQMTSYQIARSTSSAILASLVSCVDEQRLPTSAEILYTALLALGFLCTALDTRVSECTGQESGICLLSIMVGVLASSVGILFMQGLKNVYKYEIPTIAENPIILMIHIYVNTIILMPVLITVFTNEFGDIMNDLMTVRGSDSKAKLIQGGRNVMFELVTIFASALVVTPMPYCTAIALSATSPITIVIIGHLKSIIPIVVGNIIFKETFSRLSFAGLVATCAAWIISSRKTKQKDKYHR